MIHLRTLGGLELKGGDPREMRAIMAQPKRLAVLAYLALSVPRGYHRRDTLLALFWPDKDDEHARSALRQSLHAIRHSLGHDVIDSRGDYDIGLNWTAFSCDAEEFQRAIDSKRPADALELYHGELLPGFYVPAPAFEQWLDNERSRLRRIAAKEAWRLSDRAATSGDIEVALQWARHVAAFSPDDESSVKRLIQLLARLGDRTEAARVYEGFRKRLADDYQMDPSVELEALAMRTLSQRDRHQLSAWSFSPAAPERVTTSAAMRIAVLPFSVLSAAKFGYLREGAAKMLGSTLDGAGSIRVVDHHAICSFCAPDSAGDMQHGKAAAHRFAANQFVVGTVIGAGRKIQLRASLYDGDGSLIVSVESRAATEEHVFELVDDIARQLLAAEYPGPSGQLVRSAAETTASVSALRHFLEAERYTVSGRWIKASEHYSLAVADDPSLALAWARMSWCSCWLLQPGDARKFADTALASATRLSSRDAIWLHGFRAYLDGNATEAERHYRALLSRWPDDVQAYIGLGLVMVVLNPLRARAPDEGTEPLSYARILDPDNIDARLMLAYLAARRGRLEELDAFRSWLPPDSDYKMMVAVSHAIARRDDGEMAELRTALEQAPDLLVHECARYSAVVGHNVEESHRIASILTASTRVPEVRAIGHVLIALSQVTRGCIRASKPEFRAAESFARGLGGAYSALASVLPFVQTPRGELEKIRRELSAWKADKEPERGNYMSFIVHTQVYPQLRLYLLGILNVRLGKLSAALDNAAKLEKLSGPAEAIRLGFDLALSICAHVACAEGHPREALGFLEKTIMQPPYERVQMQSPFFSENAERYLRARLLEDAGRLDEALHWYETMCENGLHEFVYLAPTHFRRGVIHQRLGQRDEAATNFAKVTQLWANADAGLRPLVTQAARFC